MRRPTARRLRASSLVATIFSVLMISATVTSAGCASADGMQEKLYDATRGYNRSLRWGDWDRAAEYLPPESADGFLDSHEGTSEKLVVLDYNLTRLKLDKNTGRAACRVQISWHLDDNLVVKDTTVDQWWQFYEGAWYLVDERRVTGTPLTIFAELDDEDEDGDEGEYEGDDEDEGDDDEALASNAHPYLPGLDRFRDSRDIGLNEDEKRKRDKARRKAAREAKKAGVPDPMMDFGAPDSMSSTPQSDDPSMPPQAQATSLRGW